MFESYKWGFIFLDDKIVDGFQLCMIGGVAVDMGCGFKKYTVHCSSHGSTWQWSEITSRFYGAPQNEMQARVQVHRCGRPTSTHYSISGDFLLCKEVEVCPSPKTVWCLTVSRMFLDPTHLAWQHRQVRGKDRHQRGGEAYENNRLCDGGGRCRFYWPLIPALAPSPL